MESLTQITSNNSRSSPQGLLLPSPCAPFSGFLQYFTSDQKTISLFDIHSQHLYFQLLTLVFPFQVTIFFTTIAHFF